MAATADEDGDENGDCDKGEGKRVAFASAECRLHKLSVVRSDRMHSAAKRTRSSNPGCNCSSSASDASDAAALSSEAIHTATTDARRTPLIGQSNKKRGPAINSQEQI